MDVLELGSAESFKLVAILLLDALTVLVLVVQCVRWRCFMVHSTRWSGMLRGCKSQAKASWTKIFKWFTVQDEMVQRKYDGALLQILRTGAAFMAGALFLRFLAIQGPLLREGNLNHSLQPALDFSNMISYPLCLLIAICPQVVATWNQDLWYIAMQALCISPLFVAERDQVMNVSLITAFPRMLCGMGARSGSLPIVGNLINCAVTVYLKPEETSVLAPTAELCMVLTGFITVRQGLYGNAMMTNRLKSRTIDLGAVSQLLLGFVDAVVEIDSSLKLTEDSRQLSTLLLHNQGMTAGGLAGRDFLSFFCPEDRPRIKESLSAKTENTVAVNARMLDCLGSNLQMEVLHCHFDNAHGQRCCLVGMREFQDFGYSIAPLLHNETERMGASVFDQYAMEVSAKDGKIDATRAVPEDATVLFNADTFDVLSMSDSFVQLCAETGTNFDLESGVGIFDLSKTTGPNSFGRHLQEAINSWDESAAANVSHLEKVDLLGSIELDLTLQLQKDEVLEHLVGTLKVTRVVVDHSEPAKLTPSSLARLGAVRSNRSTRSRTSKSSRSRKSRSSHGSHDDPERSKQQLSGSILDLRRPPAIAL